MPKLSLVSEADIRRRGLSALYSPKQQDVSRWARTHDYRMLINHGAKRSGKTVIDNDLFIFNLIDVRRRADAAGVQYPQYILAGADLSALNRNVLTDIQSDYGISLKFDKANRFQLFGVLVCCFGHSKSNDLGRIRGMTSWGAYINEATMANEEVFNEILSRCSAPGSKIIMDTNPDRPSHWLKTKYVDKADQRQTAEFHWRLEDNTFLDPAYIAARKNETPSGMFYDRDINGAWVAAEGVVYPDFDRAVHYVRLEDVPPLSRYWAGMDFGWEHPGAITLFGEDEDAGNTYLLKEWSSQHRNIDDWIAILQRVQEKIGDIIVYCDSARPDLINDMQCAGIDARNAHKDVVAGIGEVATMFKQKRLFIVRENVERFDDEIDAYVWREGRDEPVKLNDDVMDSVRYAIYSDRVENENAVEMNFGSHLRRWV